MNIFTSGRRDQQKSDLPLGSCISLYFKLLLLCPQGMNRSRYGCPDGMKTNGDHGDY